MKYTEKSPYGYWISRDEVYPAIGEESHTETACHILESKFGHISKWWDVQAVMFRLGYVRAVNVGGGIWVEYRRKAKLSRLQKDFIDSAERKEYSPKFGMFSRARAL